jgi:hypothetical protein
MTTKRARPYVKLYTDLLENSRFMLLPAPVRARYFELLMLSSKSNSEGFFIGAGTTPMDLDRIAFELHLLDSTKLKNEMEALQSAGFITNSEEGWHFEIFEGKPIQVQE